jgi:hypothetical protein
MASYTYEYYYESESEDEYYTSKKRPLPAGFKKHPFGGCDYYEGYCEKCSKSYRTFKHAGNTGKLPKKTSGIAEFGYPRKKDGTRDMRYTQMCRLKKDGTPY